MLKAFTLISKKAESTVIIRGERHFRQDFKCDAPCDAVGNWDAKIVLSTTPKCVLDSFITLEKEDDIIIHNNALRFKGLGSVRIFFFYVVAYSGQNCIYITILNNCFIS